MVGIITGRDICLSLEINKKTISDLSVKVFIPQVKTRTGKINYQIKDAVREIKLVFAQFKVIIAKLKVQ